MGLNDAKKTQNAQQEKISERFDSFFLSEMENVKSLGLLKAKLLRRLSLQLEGDGLTDRAWLGLSEADPHVSVSLENSLDQIT